MTTIEDDPAAIGEATLCSALLKPKPFEVSFTLTNVDPEVIDLLCYGQSPGPHIVLGEN